MNLFLTGICAAGVKLQRGVKVITVYLTLLKKLQKKNKILMKIRITTATAHAREVSLRRNIFVYNHTAKQLIAGCR